MLKKYYDLCDRVEKYPRAMDLATIGVILTACMMAVAAYNLSKLLNY